MRPWSLAKCKGMRMPQSRKRERGGCASAGSIKLAKVAIQFGMAILAMLEFPKKCHNRLCVSPSSGDRIGPARSPQVCLI